MITWESISSNWKNEIEMYWYNFWFFFFFFFKQSKGGFSSSARSQDYTTDSRELCKTARNYHNISYNWLHNCTNVHASVHLRSLSQNILIKTTETSTIYSHIILNYQFHSNFSSLKETGIFHLSKNPNINQITSLKTSKQTIWNTCYLLCYFLWMQQELLDLGNITKS